MAIALAMRADFDRLCNTSLTAARVTPRRLAIAAHELPRIRSRALRISGCILQLAYLTCTAFCKQKFAVSSEGHTFLSEFALRLRQERERHGFSQETAAQLAFVSRVMWQKYEKAAAAPSVLLLNHLATTPFDIRFLLTGERIDTDRTLAEPEQRLLRLYRAADREGKLVIEQTAAAFAHKAAGPPTGRSTKERRR